MNLGNAMMKHEEEGIPLFRRTLIPTYRYSDKIVPYLRQKCIVIPTCRNIGRTAIPTFLKSCNSDNVSNNCVGISAQFCRNNDTLLTGLRYTLVGISIHFSRNHHKECGHSLWNNTQCRSICNISPQIWVTSFDLPKNQCLRRRNLPCPGIILRAQGLGLHICQSKHHTL